MNNNDDWLNNLGYGMDLNTDHHNVLHQQNLNNEIHSLNPHHNFDPNHPHGIVIGNPTEEMNHWHQQI